jgi:DNA-binding MarR family transcriptional regulator
MPSSNAMADDFSSDVKQFIDQNIESLAQLETLLLMRQDPQRGWDAAEIAKALYLPPEMATTLLTDFSRRGFVKAESAGETRYFYNIADTSLEQLINQVASAYQERRVAIISLIYSKPLNKVQTFADAFRLRKETPP